jgi:hypothetical protein
MRYYLLKLWSDLIGKPVYLPLHKKEHRAQNPFKSAVKYQFHLPGVNNFHLLPFKNRFQGSLNIFKPHWNKSGFMQSTTSKSVR